VLQRERASIEEEQQPLSEWFSLLKEQTTSEKQKASAKRAQLDKMELLLNQEQVSIDLLDAKAQKLMEKAIELYANAEAYADATIKSRRTSMVV
jgi:hypothetical protein